MNDTRTFPVHSFDHKHGIKSVPWAIVAPHERRAELNHGQTLERLAERGGLTLVEIGLLLCNRPYRDLFGRTDEWWAKATADALELVRRTVEAHEAGR